MRPPGHQCHPPHCQHGDWQGLCSSPGTRRYAQTQNKFKINIQAFCLIFTRLATSTAVNHLFHFLTRSPDDPTEFGILHHDFDEDREFYVAHLDHLMISGRDYMIRINFVSQLTDGLKGFYRSGYQDEEGNQRYKGWVFSYNLQSINSDVINGLTFLFSSTDILLLPSSSRHLRGGLSHALTSQPWRPHLRSAWVEPRTWTHFQICPFRNGEKEWRGKLPVTRDQLAITCYNN